MPYPSVPAIIHSVHLHVEGVENEDVLQGVGIGISFLLAHAKERGNPDLLTDALNVDQAQYHVGEVLFDMIGGIEDSYFNDCYEAAVLNMMEVLDNQHPKLYQLLANFQQFADLTFNVYNGVVQLLIREGEPINDQGSFRGTLDAIDVYQEYLNYMFVFGDQHYASVRPLPSVTTSATAQYGADPTDMDDPGPDIQYYLGY